jgi:hypothetical protein
MMKSIIGSRLEEKLVPKRLGDILPQLTLQYTVGNLGSRKLAKTEGRDD